MHILLTGNRFPADDTAGTEVLAEGLAAGLAARGLSVSWLAGGAPAGPPPDGVRTVPVGARAGLWPWDEDGTTAQVAAALAELPPVDLVHVTHFSRLGLSYLDTPALRDVPVVATLTDYTAVCADFQLRHRRTGAACAADEPTEHCASCLGLAPGAAGGLLARRIRNLRWLNERCRAVWVQTPHQRRELVSAGMRADRVVTDRAGYPLPGGWSARPAERGPSALFVGRASPEKGLDVLLRAFAQVRGPVTLTVVTRPDDDEYERGTRELAAADPRVRWLPPVRTGDLGELIAGAAVLAVPSQWRENHPLVVDYALALGTPVLSSAVDSMRHLADRGDVRFVSPVDSPVAWRDQLSRALAAPRWPGPDRVAEFERDFERFVDDTVATYVRCLEG